jgi:hypothetical protein
MCIVDGFVHKIFQLLSALWTEISSYKCYAHVLSLAQTSVMRHKRDVW